MLWARTLIAFVRSCAVLAALQYCARALGRLTDADAERGAGVVEQMFAIPEWRLVKTYIRSQRPWQWNPRS